MKKVQISLVALTLGLMSFTVVSPVADTIQKSIDAASISWKSDAIEVGQIPQGTPKNIEFEFKNTGKTAVIITSVKPSCGCTAADYTKEPVAPGKSGYIKATFNAVATGPFTQTVTVITSVDETPKVLKFAGVVAAK
jgi:hypothetical protein